MKKILVSLVILLNVSVFAQDWLEEATLVSTGLQINTILLDADFTVTTASKSAQKLSEVPAIISVVTREEIKNSGAKDLAEVINLLAGADVNTAIGLGTHNSISVRGRLTDFGEDVLVLLDGQRMNDVYTGGGLHQLKYIPLNNVQQVEFIRGPGSSLYGSNAFVGVVNVITRKARALTDSSKNEIAIEAGSFGQKGASLTSAIVKDSFSMLFNASYSEDDGEDYDFTQGYYRMPGMNYELDDPKTGYDVGLNLTVGHLSVDLDYFDREFEGFMPAGFLSNSWPSDVLDTNTSNSDVLRFQAKYELNLSDNFSITPIARYVKGEVLGEYFLAQPMNPQFMGLSAYNLGWFGAANHETENTEFEIQFNYRTESHDIVAGIVSQNEELTDVRSGYNVYPFAMPPLDFGSTISWLPDAFSYAEPNDRDVLGLYFQDTWKVSELLGLTFGLRYDDYSDFGDTLNPRAALVYKLSDKMILKALAGSAYRAPTFNELFIRFNPVEQGNENLDAQTIDTFEVQLILQPSETSKFSSTIFFNQYEDLITLQQGAGATVPVYSNASGEEEDLGLELEYRYQLSKFKYLALNYSYIEAEDDNGDDRVNIATNKAGLVFNWDVVEEKIIGNLNAFYRGDREKSPIAGTDVDDTWVVGFNIRVLKLFSENSELSISGSNIFDEDYESPSYSPSLAPENIPNRGAAFSVKLSLDF